MRQDSDARTVSGSYSVDFMDGLPHLDPTARYSRQDRFDTLRRHLGMDVAYVGEFTADTRIVRWTSPEGLDSLRVGRRDPVEETLCHAVLTGKVPAYTNDARKLGDVHRLTAVPGLSVGSYISVPIVLPGGELFGAFTGLSSEPSASLNKRDLALAQEAAAVAGRRVWRRRETDAESTRFLADVSELIEKKAVDLAWQPIVTADDGLPFGAEALARFPSFPEHGPGQLLMRARRSAPHLTLDHLVLERILDAVGSRSPDRICFVNVWPDLLLDTSFLEVLTRAPRKIVVELVEDEANVEAHVLRAAAERLKSIGHAVALDDIGAGMSNLTRLVEVRPDYLKLDRSIVSGLDRDAGRRSLVEAFVQFSGIVGGTVVAEGVERQEEWAVLQSLGVPLAQGFLFGRPQVGE
jgi:EAL domain-containing protein (putative c-di-GMP-specific phosphodiesterase class I)